jgi:hypothetical protein
MCLMKLGALALGAYRLIIVISFWCITPFVSVNCPLSCLINVSLKSTLSDISIAILPVLRVHWLVNLLSAFHPKSVFVFVNEIGIL